MSFGDYIFTLLATYERGLVEPPSDIRADWPILLFNKITGPVAGFSAVIVKLVFVDAAGVNIVAVVVVEAAVPIPILPVILTILETFKAPVIVSPAFKT